MVPKNRMHYFRRNCYSHIELSFPSSTWCSWQWTCTVQSLEEHLFIVRCFYKGDVVTQSCCLKLILKIICFKPWWPYPGIIPLLCPNMSFFRSCLFRNSSELLSVQFQNKNESSIVFLVSSAGKFNLLSIKGNLFSAEYCVFVFFF